MTEDARLARLTELALLVFGDDLAERINPISYDPDGRWVTVHGKWIGELVAVHGHPRALDALEAALLVLADEGDVPAYSRGCRDERERTLLWVEELAADMESEAERMRKTMQRSIGPLLADTVQRCAAELRARAKGER